ncbi:MFS transporter [Mumia sp. zg.B53]|uniref:MFS transporter n=1 Tax=Mumia sp. zg.B53 TaxID=2855449 RepID=UPI001C6F3AE5|nr:MFS transporter [Mumia sp. zg.B53]MBW9215058.1 MFS transporter [Mumia sp. zg.B53]
MTQTTTHVPDMTRKTWAALLTLAGAGFATVTIELLPAGLLPSMAHDLGVSRGRIGLLVTAWALTVAALSLPLERLTRRLPRRGVMLGAVLVSAGAALLAATAPAYGPLVVARVVAAGAHGLLWALLVPYAASLVDERHIGKAVSVVLVGPTAAGVVGVPLGTAAAELVGWRAVLVGAGVLLVVASLALVTVLPPGAAPGKKPVPAGAVPAGRDRSLVRVTVTATLGALVLVGHFQVFTYVGPLVTRVAGMDSAALGGVLALFGATGALGLAIAGPLSDRFPTAALPGTAIAFAITVLAITALDTSTVVALVVVGVWGTMIGLFPPVFQSTVMRIASPAARGAAGAVVVTALNLGIAAGAASGAWLLENRGVDALAPVAALAVGVAATGLVISAARGARSPAPRRGDGGRPPAPQEAEAPR